MAKNNVLRFIINSEINEMTSLEKIKPLTFAFNKNISNNRSWLNLSRLHKIKSYPRFLKYSDFFFLEA
jgi:cytoplasmic iron level regulating protein YaaA (DUF328/UPF0246 family)